MARTRRLKWGEVIYSTAREGRKRPIFLLVLKTYEQTVKYFSHFLKHSNLVQKAAAYHLSISLKECEPDGFNNWLFGSFNLLRIYHYFHDSYIIFVATYLSSLDMNLRSGCVRRKGLMLDGLRAGYLLIQYIDKSEGTMLSCSWNDKRHDKDLHANLFKGLT
ncbi:hypothetical protein BDFG_04534 [Blastomyces dermatitidis ATCC 26199]|nr:hypothetical protein BDFG_04534 [Blastomyces dermatitidis ATCC 26199]